MNRERLTRLRDLLTDTDWSAVKYDVRCWETDGVFDSIGLAMNTAWFREEGLRPYPPEPEAPRRWPVFKSFVGTRAAAQFFGVPMGVAEWLFAPWAYDESEWQQPSATVNRLNHVLGGGGVVLHDDSVWKGGAP